MSVKVTFRMFKGSPSMINDISHKVKDFSQKTYGSHYDL